MLDKDIFFKKMDELVMSYPNWKLNYNDKKVMKFWYKQFEKMEGKHFAFMVNKYKDNDKFNPTIAGLKQWDIMPKKSRSQRDHEEMLKENGLL